LRLWTLFITHFSIHFEHWMMAKPRH
jgi:hypothetical protein